MLRKINYTVSPHKISPAAPQFAGVQGEDRATTLTFLPDAEFKAAVQTLGSKYDQTVYRVDCSDGAGRLITGEVLPFGGETVEFPLSKEYTVTGGKLKGCLIISGVNNTGENDTTALFSIPFQLYFKDFPIAVGVTAASDLNKIVVQVKKLRSETYDIAAVALTTKTEIKQLEDVIGRSAADAVKRADDASAQISATAAETVLSLETLASEVKTASDTAVAGVAQVYANAKTEAETVITAAQNAHADIAAQAAIATDAADSAQESANSAAAYTVIAKNASQSAADSAGQAISAGQIAQQNLETLLTVTGDINALLATVVSVT